MWHVFQPAAFTALATDFPGGGVDARCGNCHVLFDASYKIKNATELKFSSRVSDTKDTKVLKPGLQVRLPPV